MQAKVSTVCCAGLLLVMGGLQYATMGRGRVNHSAMTVASWLQSEPVKARTVLADALVLCTPEKQRAQISDPKALAVAAEIGVYVITQAASGSTSESDLRKHNAFAARRLATLKPRQQAIATVLVKEGLNPADRGKCVLAELVKRAPAGV